MKSVYRMSLKLLCMCIAVVAVAAPAVLSAGQLPPEKAGTIGQPEGMIAFTRQKDVWVMNADGTNQHVICEVKNADGRVSWSPDNKRVAFTRSGGVDLKGPDMLGGFHKVYDIFIASLDSAKTGNMFFWRRISNDVGSRDPQWTADNKILFWKDMNANMITAGQPNYQVCMSDTDGTFIKVLRDDWKDIEHRYLTGPSISPDGKIAAVYFQNMRPVGLVVLPREKINIDLDTIAAMAAMNPKCVAPSWSPDGKWLAYISNDINDAGLYLTTPDLKERYLVFEPPVGTYLNTVAPSFSPDSKWLTFATTDKAIWICDITGKGARKLTAPGLDLAPAWSNAVKK